MCYLTELLPPAQPVTATCGEEKPSLRKPDINNYNI